MESKGTGGAGDTAPDALFEAVKNNDLEAVRALLTEDKALASVKRRIAGLAWPQSAEADGIRFCGAYLGAVTALQYAIFLELDDLATEIADATLGTDIDVTCGGQNTALHLACLLGEKSLVQVLLARGASTEHKNAKGFTPVSIVDDPEGWFDVIGVISLRL